jgi:hypothetical protein
MGEDYRAEDNLRQHVAIKGCFRHPVLLRSHAELRIDLTD